MGPNTKGFYEYLPQSYASGGQHPVIIFLHGRGDLGNGTTDLPKLLQFALPYYINQGRFPKSFTVNGTTHQFVVISPQFVSWPTAIDVNGVIDYVASHYRINPNRIYVTGCSMGGGVTWEHAGSANGYVARLAAVAPVCGATNFDMSRAYRIADAKLPVWALHNNNDPQVPVSNTNNYIANILARNPSAPVKKTIFNSASHDAWTTAYNPDFREAGKNMYEWMLQYAKGASTPATNKPPVSNAGSNITLTLPANSVALNGSASYDPEGGSLRYTWAKTSGPSQFTLSNGLSARPTVSNLAAGVYQFRLDVVDPQGASATSYVQVTVNGSTGGSTLTVNAGPDASVTLPVNYHIVKGSSNGGADTKYAWLKISGGPVNIVSPNLAKTNILWMTQGTYVFELVANNSSGALVRDQVVIRVLPPVNGAAATQAESSFSYNDEVVVGSLTAGASVFPNPVDQQFQLTVDNEYSGKIQIAIFDETGKPVQQTEMQKTVGRVTKTINLVPTLHKGIYFLKLQSGKEVNTIKLMKK